MIRKFFRYPKIFPCSLGFALAFVLVSLLGSTSAHADIFYGKNQAIEIAFPTANRIERKTLVISREKAKYLEKIADSHLPSRLITIYEGWKGDKLLGYMHIDVHPVWAKSEALMIVLTPTGEFSQIKVLAFHEDTRYMLPNGVLQSLIKKTGDDPIKVGEDVDAISGASITLRSSTGALRRARAYYQVLLQGSDDSESP